MVAELPFLIAYISMRKLLVAADGLLTIFFFAVSSCPAAMLPLFSICVPLLFRY